MSRILSCDDDDDDDDDDRDAIDSQHATLYLNRLQNANPSGRAA
jgi:hypothetical protein